MGLVCAIPRTDRCTLLVLEGGALESALESFDCLMETGERYYDAMNDYWLLSILAPQFIIIFIIIIL